MSQQNKTQGENEYDDRKKKLEMIASSEKTVFKDRFERNSSALCIVKEYGIDCSLKKARTLEEISNQPIAEKHLAGRITLLRPHGKLTFAHLTDESGKIQICLTSNVLGNENYSKLKFLDLGDFLGVKGEVFLTKHGEITLLVTEFSILSKTLRPMPEKFHGLKDTEMKYRYRYLELISDPSAAQRFRLRSTLIKALRDYLDETGFLEVETPILTSVASGATAEPFETHHRALDIPLFLRIAPETYLKRCVVGGFEKVYEIGKCFRNEGIDPSHLQEFTMLEYYASYWNYEDNMRFTEKMLKSVIKRVCGSLKVKTKDRDGNTREIDFGNEWPIFKFTDLIKENSGIDIMKYNEDAFALRKIIKNNGLEIEKIDSLGFGNLCDALYKKTVRPKLINPCFVINHPVDTKPLARKNDADPRLADSFQLLVNTWEIVNAYSELIDPIDQKERLLRQVEAKEAGDEEAMPMDDDYIFAMEHGMPPISGWGMGIDRIIALLTDRDNLKDTVLFPIMKPLNDNSQEFVE